MVTTVPPAHAATPADTLVLAWAIDDIISLDPGEAFELSAAEVTGNTYSKLVTINIDDTSKVIGDLATLNGEFTHYQVADDLLKVTGDASIGAQIETGTDRRCAMRTIQTTLSSRRPASSIAGNSRSCMSISSSDDPWRSISIEHSVDPFLQR